ncbi:MAG: DUF5008 domain-containing protein, partial [Flavobacterium sp.]
MPYRLYLIERLFFFKTSKINSMKHKYTILMVLFAALVFGGCKEEGKDFENPYDNGKEPLGIVTNAQQIPVPASGEAGTEVVIAATGLMKFKEGELK